MFKNYLKIAWRQLRKQKFYSAIKIGGFALGIATCLLITLYIRNELSYDQDYPDGDRIYRMTGVFNDHGTLRRGASWQAPMAAALKNDIPAVASVARLMPSALFWGAGSNQFRPVDKEQDTYEVVIASPISYLGMNKWLQDYVYRIDIGIWMFAGAGLLVALIALLTISAQALRAATTNPVEALRTGE